MSAVKKTGASLPWVALLLLMILTSLLMLEGEQVVTQAHSPPQGVPVGMRVTAPGQTTLVLEKAAWPVQVINGGLVTYTVMISNTGQMTGTVEAIVDTLDPGLSFAAVLSGSDLIDPPQEIANTLTWTGPFTLAAGSALTILYQVQTPPVDGWLELCNRVEVSTTEAIQAPAQACVAVRPERLTLYLPHVTSDFEPARLAVEKSASPGTLVSDPAAEVVYTVTVANVGDTTGALLAVNDTLPADFAFLGMAAGSDVTANPVGTSGTIAWNGDWPMPPGGQLDLVYRVRPSEVPGHYGNSVSVVARGALVPAEPAVANVVVEPNTWLEEDFDDPAVGLSRWTKFLNYWRLEEGQWRWEKSAGVGGSGAATQDCWLGGRKVAEDALLMYLGPGAEEWTDYRVETKMLLRGGVTDRDDGTIVVIEEGGYPVGLWVRGQYEDVGDTDTAGWVTGYYVIVGGKPSNDTMFVRLSQLQTLTDCWDQACNNPQNLYDFNNPRVLHEVKLNRSFKRYTWYTLAVEVRGNNIKVFFENELVIDYIDVKEPFLKGTIGFKTYKSKTVSFDNVVVTPLSD